MGMRQIGRVGAAVAAIVACGACAAPASATRTELARMPSYSPRLVAGGAVFFSPAKGQQLVVRAVQGSAPQTLTSFDNPPGSGGEFSVSVESDLELSSSNSYVAAARWVHVSVKGATAENSYRIEAGPAAGPLAVVHQCSDDHPIEVDGTLLAQTNGCTEAHPPNPPVLVRDLAQAGVPTVAAIAQTSRVTEIQMAGQHLALLRAPGGKREIAVRDYAQPNDAYVVPAENARGFALQADGKLVVKEQTQQTCRLLWYSKAEPTAHPIDVCPYGGVYLAGDRIMLERETDSVASLDIVNLSGALVQKVAAFGAAGMITGLDFDGSRVAYTVSGCVQSRDQVFVDDLVGEPTAADSTACPVVFTTKKVRATSKGLVSVGLNCKEGCQGYMSLTRGGKSIVTDVKLANLDPGSGKVTLRLGKSARKLLKDKGELSVKAIVQAGQRNGIPRDFKKTLKLLAPK